MRNSTKIQPEKRKPRILPKESISNSELNERKPQSNVERILQEFQNKIPEIANTEPKIAKPKWSEPEIAQPGRNIVQNVPPVLYNDPIRRAENRLKETKPLPPQTPDLKTKEEHKIILNLPGMTIRFNSKIVRFTILRFSSRSLPRDQIMIKGRIYKVYDRK